MSDTLDCPYCDREIYVEEHPNENSLTEEECAGCGKIFVWSFELTPSYSPYECPCKNGEEHVYEVRIKYTHEGKKQYEQCAHCEEIKEIEA